MLELQRSDSEAIKTFVEDFKDLNPETLEVFIEILKAVDELFDKLQVELEFCPFISDGLCDTSNPFCTSCKYRVGCKLWGIMKEAVDFGGYILHLAILAGEIAKRR